ncbi:hypothetical protein [Nocardiopsis sp. L17-MgMaSL7]|uniref:hypothetical protein n=1 Tax=Nocardiopsis sp. L17-MgMaSL7 TaxID=1938893 RepID=UPI000D8886E2|nr:hypothetical protein [Nocardiopsis sp. L17-MgMaSL7]PWV45071.1 hypothetical protein BDW27_11920 [Nocardiopsis sp. L17-MgMaSL7]
MTQPPESSAAPEPERDPETNLPSDAELAERWAAPHRSFDPIRGVPADGEGLPRPTTARWVLAGIVLAAFAALLAVRVTRFGGLDQTALFYVGLPAFLALLVILCVQARGGLGTAMAVTTVCLLLAGPMLGEGMVCLVISAPLIYGVVALVAWVVTSLRRRGRRHPHAMLAVPILFALAMEGIGGFSLLPREDSGTGSVLVGATPAEVAAALAAPPGYDAPDAFLLSAVPFPEPVEAVGSGLEAGDTRTVHFTPRRTLAPGAEPTPRHLGLEVAESDVRADGGRVVFEVTEDTAFANWMEMERAVATWRGEPDGTRLTWEIEYTRTYDPSWYFGPVQSHVTGLAADYLARTFQEEAQALTGGEPRR